MLGCEQRPVARAVEAHVPRDGRRLEDRAPAGVARAPGDVGVAGPQRHVLVEDLGADRDRVQRLAAVEHAGAIAAEDLARAGMLRARLAMADERVLAPPVERHPRGIDHVEPVGRLHARRAEQQRRDGADAGLAEPRVRRGQEPAVEHAVGVQEQDRWAAGGGEPGVHRRRIRAPFAQRDPPRAVLLAERRGAVRARVVDHDNIDGRLRGGGRQRALEQVRLVDAQHEDRRGAHNSSR